MSVVVVGVVAAAAAVVVVLVVVTAMVLVLGVRVQGGARGFTAAVPPVAVVVVGRTRTQVLRAQTTTLTGRVMTMTTTFSPHGTCRCRFFAASLS